MATDARIMAGSPAAWGGDLHLARRCIAREPAAIRELTGANNQRLFRAAWSILRDRAEAEEAVQSGYLKAFSALDSFAGESSLSTWLTRIVVNEALGKLRASARRRARLEGKGVTLLDEYREKFMRGSEPVRPDAAVAREQLRQLIEKAVAGLPDLFRTVFVLRAVEGLSVEETAQVLGIAEATVKTRMLRARRRLQQALEPDVRSALEGVFPFAGADCDAMTARLLATLSIR
jgi:RNA polymerase sigma-70 factor, ECF subfamily